MTIIFPDLICIQYYSIFWEHKQNLHNLFHICIRCYFIHKLKNFFSMLFRICTWFTYLEYFDWVCANSQCVDFAYSFFGRRGGVIAWTADSQLHFSTCEPSIRMKNHLHSTHLGIESLWSWSIFRNSISILCSLFVDRINFK